MWRYLQRNNTQNNIFMLQTIRKELVDFSIEKYLSMDREDPSFKIYKSMVIEEIKENIWFYFREIVMIPDSNSITGYKHFELTEENMKMIYLYDKQKSFINLHGDNTLCLHFLWNRYSSMFNTDIVLVNNHDVIKELSNDIRKHIASMECQIPIGSNQIISDHTNRYITCNMNAFNNYYIINRNYNLIDNIKYIYNQNAQQNHWVKGDLNIFILENDMPLITYSCLIKSFKNNNYKLYLNGIHNDNSIDKEVLKNFLKGCFSTALSPIYDTEDNELKDLYLV
jgi:hypothetical protein